MSTTKPLPLVSQTSVLSVVGTQQKPLVPSRQQRLKSSESSNDNRQSKPTNDNSLWLVSNVHGKLHKLPVLYVAAEVVVLSTAVAVVEAVVPRLISLSVSVLCSKLIQAETVRCLLLSGVRWLHTLQTMVSASVGQAALLLRCGSTLMIATGKTINSVTIGICRRLLGWMILSFQL
nr:MAG TPA: hypothetical protein [Caudoviricetes sp.]